MHPLTNYKLLDNVFSEFACGLKIQQQEILADYCKRKGADGVCFNSSLHAGGMNYVLFNPNDAACISVLNREIKSVDINV